MEIVNVLLAILLLLVGAGYPMYAIWRLSQQLNRKDSPMNSTELIVQFVLIAAVPLAAMLGGFALLVPSLWESVVIRVIVYASTGIAIGALIAQAWLGRSSSGAEETLD